MILNRYRRKCPTVDASIFDSALSHTRRSDTSEKEKKIACQLLDVFACGQVSSPRLHRLNVQIKCFPDLLTILTNKNRKPLLEIDHCS